MSTNTKIKLKPALEASKTMSGKNKKQYKKSAKSTAARSELIRRSIIAKQQIKKIIDQAKSQEEAEAAACIRVNEILMLEHRDLTGAKTFMTFHDWKKEGYKVKAKEVAFRVWGSPIKGKKELDATDVKTGEDTTIEAAFSMFPMCCLFHEGQVAPLDADSEESRDTVVNIKQVKDVDESGPSTLTVGKKAEVSTIVNGDKKTALRLATLAEGMQTKIDSCFSDRLTNTPKRLAQARHAQIEGHRLERTQKVLSTLSCLYKAGTVPADLLGIKTKSAIYDLMGMELEPVCNGYHAYYIENGQPRDTSAKAVAFWKLLSPKSEADKKADALQAKIDGLQFSNIPGYFPTPAPVLDLMMLEADLQEGQRVADTSAGSGNILDAVKEEADDLTIEAYEYNHSLREILAGKGYSVIGGDYLAITVAQKFDRILINPPFENLQDVDHVRKSFDDLAPGGRLVAIMSPSAFFRSDKKSVGFREWFCALDGHSQDLPENSFKESGTNVATKMIVVDKPDKTGTDDDCPFVCQDYENKQEDRKVRYEQRASNAAKASNDAYTKGQKMASVIPFGQPVLIGHHSEKRDRAYRKIIDDKFDKSIEQSTKAEYYARKAASVGACGIASDDPEAITKLKTKRLKLEHQQSLMKNANRAIKKNDDSALLALGLKPLEIERLKIPDFAGRIGYAPYLLTNNGAEIRRVKKRIECLNMLRISRPFAHECESFNAYIDDGRIHFKFDGKPSDSIREHLKSNGFKFSRYSATWVRKATANGIAIAENVASQITRL